MQAHTSRHAYPPGLVRLLRAPGGDSSRREGGRLTRPIGFLPRTLLALAALGCADAGGGGLDGPPPGPAERLAGWAELPGRPAVPVALGFGGNLADSTIASLLERHGLRPYAIYMKAAALAGSHRRERSRASLEVLGEAREQAVAQLRTSLCAQPGRARAMLAESGQGDPTERYRAVLSHFLRIRRTLPELELGAPLAYGVEAVGALPEVRAVASDPIVVSFEPGWRTRIEGVDTVVLPQPPAPPEDGDESDAEVAAWDPVRVHAEMLRLAEDGMGSCIDGARPDQ